VKSEFPFYIEQAITLNREKAPIPPAEIEGKIASVSVNVNDVDRNSINHIKDPRAVLDLMLEQAEVRISAPQPGGAGN